MNKIIVEILSSLLVCFIAYILTCFGIPIEYCILGTIVAYEVRKSYHG